MAVTKRIFNNFFPDATGCRHRQSRCFMPPRIELKVWGKVGGVFQNLDRTTGAITSRRGAFHRRLTSSPAQLCPPHEAIMASSLPRLGKAAAGQCAGHGLGQRREEAPDNQPHSHRASPQPQTRQPLLGPRASRALPPPSALLDPRARAGEGRLGSSL